MSYDIEAPTRPATARELPAPRPAPDSAAQDVLQGCHTLSLDDADASDGALDRVELPPCLPGLPNTAYRNCSALICAIVWQGIVDRDHHWCAGPIFNWYLSLLGWDNAQILAAKRAVLHGHPKLLRYSQANFLNDAPLCNGYDV